MEKAAICARPYFVHYIWFEIAVDGAGNIFALAYTVYQYLDYQSWHTVFMLTSLGEESAETLIGIGSLTLLRQISVRLEGTVKLVDCYLCFGFG